jgi:Ni/Co efflux regulator RcnB
LHSPTITAIATTAMIRIATHKRSAAAIRITAAAHGASRRRENRGRANSNADRRDERGAGPNHDFRRGQRLPAEYRNRQYVVDDWRGHHLSAPPRGYHWVQTGGDYVLVAIATGVILQLLLNQ